jgi:hypothetical protein
MLDKYNMSDSEIVQNDYSTEMCVIGYVFWLSDIINRCSSCCTSIYENNDCIKDTVDCTSFITEYSCKACSSKREEPMEKTWISTNYVEPSSNELVENYIILEDFEISRYNEYFSTYTSEKRELVIVKGYNRAKKETYYICCHPSHLITFFRIEISTIRFLSINYRCGEENPVSIKIDKEWLTVGNEILGYTHVLRMLEHQSEPFVFNMDYTLDIIDSDIQVFQIKSNEYLKIEKDGYSRDVVIFS